MAAARPSLFEFLSKEEGAAALLDAALVETDAVGEYRSLLDDVKVKMVSMQTRLDDRERQVESLVARAKVQAEQERKREEENAVLVRRLRDEFDTAMERQLAFTKGVIKEKEEMARKMETIIGRNDAKEKELNERLANFKQEEGKRVRKLKETWKVADRSRREKLIDEMRATIKQDTIRALEPEVQRLIDQGAADRRKAVIDRERAIEELSEAHRIVLADLRDTLHQEHDHVVQEERRAANDRIQRLAQDQEWAIDQARRRLEGDWEEERRRMAIERAEERIAFEDAIRVMQRSLDHAARGQSVSTAAAGNRYPSQKISGSATRGRKAVVVQR